MSPKGVVGVIENKRDAGLVRAVGPWALAASIFNIVVGAGIFAVPSALAASIGPYAPLAIVFCGLVVGAVAICFAEGGSRLPTSGGPYGYIEAVFGPLVGYVAGTLLWFGDVLACGGVSAALADVIASPSPPHLREPVRIVTIVGVIGTIAIVNISGVARGAALASTVSVLKLLPLAIFVIAGAFAVHAGHFAVEVHAGVAGLGRAVLLALFAFIGMETSLSASGEIARPASTIPRALALSMGSITLLYVLIQVIAQGILGGALAASTAPLADAMARINPGLQLLMLAGAAVSMFGWIGSDILGSPRMLFASARDGLLPAVLGRTHARYRTPHVAILSYAAIAIVLASTGSFVELAVLSTLTTTVLYSAGCMAAWLLARRGVAFAGTPLGFRWLGAAAATGIAGMLAMIALASRAEVLGLIALICGSALLYQGIQWTRPSRVASS